MNNFFQQNTLVESSWLAIHSGASSILREDKFYNYGE